MTAGATTEDRMKNPKTTLGGILVAVASVAAAVGTYLKTGALDVPSLIAALTGLFAAFGLYKAQDPA